MARKNFDPTKVTRPVFADPTAEVQAIATEVEAAVGAILNADRFAYEQVTSYLTALKAECDDIRILDICLPVRFSINFSDGHLIHCIIHKVFSDEVDETGMRSADPIGIRLEMMVRGPEIGEERNGVITYH